LMVVPVVVIVEVMVDVLEEETVVDPVVVCVVVGLLKSQLWSVPETRFVRALLMPTILLEQAVLSTM